MVTPHNTLWGFDNLDTRRVKVIARKADHEWLMELHSDGSESLSFITTRTDKVDFTPCLTPEQKEAMTREQAIEEMAGTAHIPGQPFMTKREVAARLYDAGYRKQVTP